MVGPLQTWPKIKLMSGETAACLLKAVSSLLLLVPQVLVQMVILRIKTSHKGTKRRKNVPLWLLRHKPRTRRKRKKKIKKEAYFPLCLAKRTKKRKKKRKKR